MIKVFSLNQSHDLEQVVNLLQKGGIGVIPTDTIYGIVGSALKPEVVEKIYELRKRNKSKPMIILISSLEDLSKFKVEVSAQQEEVLKKAWPNPVSIILPCPKEKFAYLHRGTNTLAFRWPKDEWLVKLLSKSGPLVAPSANTEGYPPAQTIEESQNYFEEKVDFYINGGQMEAAPSTLIKLEDGGVKILRQGAFKVDF